MTTRKITHSVTFPLPTSTEKTLKAEQSAAKSTAWANRPSGAMYFVIFAVWIAAIIWFQPRLLMLLDLAHSTGAWISLALFIAFIDFAWLYGIYNIAVVGFAIFYRFFSVKSTEILSAKALAHYPPVAILYTTCNDFVEESVLSCVQQDYPFFKVYILDDSSQEMYKNRVDAFAAQYPELVQVVRRPDRKGYKAGNMNHGLEKIAQEPYFAIADADEILPRDFLLKTVPVMEHDPNCAFVQANHRANPNSTSELSKSLGVGIDIHWKWYQPLRNRFGFVMFLGHGALLRRKCWEEIGGFPDIVSEDLGFAIHAREAGYRGRFLENVVCYEDFPDSVRAFRVRHMKWTRGTSEFLSLKGKWLLKAKNIPWMEKCDILFPTMNLPLTLVYFLFMINANLILPAFLGFSQDVTVVLAGKEFVFPMVALDPGFQVIYDWDFYAITLMTFFAPVLSFIIALFTRPWKLFKFLSHSTALYAALTPLSSVGVLAYLISGKAVFLVTGDTRQQVADEGTGASKNWRQRWSEGWQNLIGKSHPDTKLVQQIEIATGLLFGIAAVVLFQLSFLGLCLAFIMLPILHHFRWDHPVVRRFVYVPFLLILAGVLTSGLSAFGMKSVFFGYGFHF